jgi:hypothetical protein
MPNTQHGVSRQHSIARALIGAIFSINTLIKLIAIGALACGFAYLNRGFLSVDLYETGDFAANSLLVQQAKQLELLVGNYSRVGFNHPGPAILYVLAWGEWLFHDCLAWVKAPFAGQIIAEGVYSAFWIVMLTTLLLRMYRSIVITGLTLTLILTATVYFEYNIIFGLWFPHLYYLPFATFTLALALLIAGRGDSLLILAVSCGFLIHGHVSFVAICGFMLLGALAVNYYQANTNHAVPRLLSLNYLHQQCRTLWMVAALLVLFLSPLALETIRHFPGPIAKYRAFSSGNKHHSFSNALQFVASYWATGLLPVITAVLALTFFAKNGSAGARDTAVVQAYRAAVPALLLATAALVLYAMFGIDDLGFNYVGLFYFSVPAIAVTILLTSHLIHRKRLTQIVVAIAIIAPALPYTIKRISKPVAYASHYHNAAIAGYDAKISALGDNLVLDLDTAGDWGKLWSTMTGIEIYGARQRGALPFCINKNWHVLFTAAAQCTKEQLQRGARYWVSTDKIIATQWQPLALDLDGIGFYKILPVPVAANQPLDVAANRALFASNLLLGGWSAPAETFVWSEGKQATLIFKIDADAKPSRLELELEAYLPNDKSQQIVDIAINDNKVATLHFDAQHNRGKYSLDLTPLNIAADVLITVQFTIHHPLSPKALGLSDDARLLGIGLHGIELKN